MKTALDALNVLADVKLSLNAARFLAYLSEHGTTPVGKVSAAIGISSAGGTTVLDRLARLKLATRADEPGDRRKNCARITDRGADVIRAFWLA